MKLALTFSFVLASMLLISACGSGDGTPAGRAKAELNVKGKIADVADAGYPLVVVMVQVPGQAEPMEFTLSNEQVEGRYSIDSIHGINARNLADLVGKAVELRYKVVEKMTLMELELNGKSLLDGEPPAKLPEWKKVTGTLDGADTESGDLPNNISVTAKDGKKADFEFFVFEKMLQANKKEVTAWYETREEKELTYMQVAQ